MISSPLTFSVEVPVFIDVVTGPVLIEVIFLDKEAIETAILKIVQEEIPSMP
ncbi:MAG: hypothetical protein HY538_01150 [Deltaproteobacteria bacterium]|nr:hypothetical protein [Deltaproteobacteria bacterium]